MALIRWEPVRELGTIQNEMNRLFDMFFEGDIGPTTGRLVHGDGFPRSTWFRPTTSSSCVPIYRLERASGPFARSLMLPAAEDNRERRARRALKAEDAPS
jgi:hypothetical protein